jgi:hypothetical protein
LFVLGAPVCAAAPQIAGRVEAGSDLPPGVKAVWDLEKAYRESPPARERLSINGLWRWQPAAGEEAPPAVPGSEPVRREYDALTRATCDNV